MYGRYFMWNFAGRQNDTQGFLDQFDGNWISGIPAIDSMRLGPQVDLPDDVKNNKGRNTYYFLPLILGLLGLYFMIRMDVENFTFYLFSSYSLVLQLSSTPIQNLLSPENATMRW